MALLLPKCQSVKFPFFYHTLLCHILQPLIEDGREPMAKGTRAAPARTKKVDFARQEGAIACCERITARHQRRPDHRGSSAIARSARHLSGRPEKADRRLHQERRSSSSSTFRRRQSGIPRQPAEPEAWRPRQREDRSGSRRRHRQLVQAARLSSHLNRKWGAP